ncbi:DUF2617 family protein [Gordonia zhaorongruii]|uniref:DUF2617 family protein n=1 Tax=Gordonia zhaorongruii TaxID=2597659 RepID=UPI0010443731|nr:DUF2617 family protein [Gordonia zhaorongruii]
MTSDLTDATVPISRELPVAYTDTSAHQLGFSLAAPEQDALAVADGEVAGFTVSLRLLGASHQVLASGGGHRLCETVACLPENTSPMPSTFREPGYRFTSSVEQVTEAELHERVVALDRIVADHQTQGTPALIGRFPGSPLAVTAVVAAPGEGGVTWRTWHTYPQTGEVVSTRSAMRTCDLGTPDSVGTR